MITGPGGVGIALRCRSCRPGNWSRSSSLRLAPGAAWLEHEEGRDSQRAEEAVAAMGWRTTPSRTRRLRSEFLRRPIVHVPHHDPALVGASTQSPPASQPDPGIALEIRQPRAVDPQETICAQCPWIKGRPYQPIGPNAEPAEASATDTFASFVSVCGDPPSRPAYCATTSGATSSRCATRARFPNPDLKMFPGSRSRA